MTPEEIQHLKDTIKDASRYANRHDPIWIKAFEEYNEANRLTHLGMSCSPCYGKVLKHFTDKSEA